MSARRVSRWRTAWAGFVPISDRGEVEVIVEEHLRRAAGQLGVFGQGSQRIGLLREVHVGVVGGGLCRQGKIGRTDQIGRFGRGAKVDGPGLLADGAQEIAWIGDNHERLGSSDRCGCRKQCTR